MTTRGKVWGAALLAVALGACHDDPWEYRPLDASPGGDAPASDRPIVTPDAGDAVATDGPGADAVAVDAAPDDAAVADGGADVVVGPDASDIDVAMPDAMSGVDAMSTPDAAMPDATSTPDGSAAGLALRGAGFVSTGANTSAVGTLRLRETGFEFGSRTCSGALCLVGGLTP